MMLTFFFPTKGFTVHPRISRADCKRIARKRFGVEEVWRKE